MTSLFRPATQSHSARNTSRWTAAVRRRALLLSVVFGTLATGCNSVSKESPKERLAKAEAMFAERCKKAGVFIHRTVDDVEGVFLLKVRPDAINYGENVEQQFRLDDPYGTDSAGERYIQFFLRSALAAARSSWYPPVPPPTREGYHFVDAVDPKDGQRYRYTSTVREHEVISGYTFKKIKITGPVLDRTIAPDPGPRYGVTYDDLSTREEREYWIAGSSLRVIDLQTSEVIAERVGYMMDRGQGNNSGGRSPWLHARRDSCPPVEVDNQARRFVEKVLRPTATKGE